MASAFSKRLASRPFLTSILVIVVLAIVGFLSFHAVGNLVSVNREIATRTVPAVRLAASTREAIPPLVRLETRVVVLNDPRLVAVWNERAARVAEDLDRLASATASEQETAQLAAARTAFARYRRVVAESQALLRRGDRTGA